MKYPVYIPSYHRAETCTTPDLLADEPYHLVIHDEDAEAYADRFGEDRLLILPFDPVGHATAARNWIKEHAEAEYHWQIDDNIQSFRYNSGQSLESIDASSALTYMERFVDRFKNIGGACPRHTNWAGKQTKPFQTNVMIYCCMLCRTDVDLSWRGPVGQDVYMSLQLLSSGGHTEYYQQGGRYLQAESLRRRWPNLVSITRRHGRSAHSLGHVWQYFDQPLIPNDEATS